MKCPIDRGILKEITVYGETYLMCRDCQESGENTYWKFPEDSESYFAIERIEDIVEYKNEIRRKSLKKYYNVTDVEDED